MLFVWEPTKPHAAEGIEVTEVKHNGEALWIKSRPVRMYNGIRGPECWNEENRFREACWMGPVEEGE
jgi:hypothetical protein